MAKVVGIRFKRAGKIYHFSPGNIETKLHDHVIVETSRGIEFGEIVIAAHEEESDKIVQPLKEVLRIATEEDIAHEAENKRKEMEAFAVCFDKIRKHGLEMKLIDCEYTFDNSKILFYFTADGRIDFRDLVKDLASIFHTRIELRQEGVRDETKTLGGLGCCGRELCCHAYLSDFVPVSIKMAKEQNLSLNTTKISGVCGRLMCCLKYEENVYEELNRKLPSAGDYATTPDGLRGVVSSVSILKQKVKVLVDLPNDEKEMREYYAEEITFRSRKKGNQQPANEDLAPEVRMLEDEQRRENREIGESRSRGENRENRNENRENRDSKDSRDNRENRGEKHEKHENRNRGEKREKRENKENRENRGEKSGKSRGGRRHRHHGNRGPKPEGGEKSQGGEKPGNNQ